MRTEMAFVKGEINRHREQMVFDWDAAARHIVQHKIMDADAGLENDWEWTGGPILRDGKIVPRSKTYTYLASTWAQPQLQADYSLFPCWRMESETEWDADTYWPDSARAILDQKTDFDN